MLFLFIPAYHNVFVTPIFYRISSFFFNILLLFHLFLSLTYYFLLITFFHHASFCWFYPSFSGSVRNIMHIANFIYFVYVGMFNEVSETPL